MSTKVTLNMKLDIFTALQSLSLSFFNNNQTGRLITRVNYDADRIRSFFIDGVPNFVINRAQLHRTHHFPVFTQLEADAYRLYPRFR